MRGERLVEIYKIEMLICSYLRLFGAADFSLAHASEIP